MAEVVVPRSGPIPAALLRSHLVVLPDRSGFLSFLDPHDALACPACGRAMAFALLVQQVGPGPAAPWSYRCLTCPAVAA
jgi:hypothetical protein